MDTRYWDFMAIKIYNAISFGKIDIYGLHFIYRLVIEQISYGCILIRHQLGKDTPVPLFTRIKGMASAYAAVVLVISGEFDVTITPSSGLFKNTACALLYAPTEKK
ncbi:MAG: hypothetical protein ACLPN1_12760 [Dissulfurispiraceae bacterium]|jgi:hypothetical protein